jgi:molybdenum cofactor cytidylyltransferase
MKTAVLLMAAGNSRRFGSQNKLLASLHGRPLIAHAAGILRQLPLAHRIAIAADDDVAALLTGFEIIRAKNAASNMSENIAAGVRMARQMDAERLLIALGDMPFVTRSHFEKLLTAVDPKRPMASSDGAIRMPPATFPASYFARLLSLESDAGAARIIRELPERDIVLAGQGELRDVDFPSDL